MRSYFRFGTSTNFLPKSFNICAAITSSPIADRCQSIVIEKHLRVRSIRRTHLTAPPALDSVRQTSHIGGSHVHTRWFYSLTILGSRHFADCNIRPSRERPG